jgi:uncharacterized membrane protein YcaP (DUF421 family)
MKIDDVKIDDWLRIFIGDVPGIFYLELIIRAAIIYFILMVSIRLMGKRMSSELSRNEMAAVVSLAAAIGVPLMNPDRGLLPVLIIAGVIICAQMLIAWLATKSERFEEISQDRASLLVKDGVLQLKSMQRTRITKERLFAELRCNEIKQLGAVKRLYLEAGGFFTLVKSAVPAPGLSIVPDWDQDFVARLAVVDSVKACRNCGNTKENSDSPTRTVCCHCSGNDWGKAVSN